MEQSTMTEHQEAKAPEVHRECTLPNFVISDPIKQAAAIFEASVERRNKRWQLINELAQCTAPL